MVWENSAGGVSNFKEKSVGLYIFLIKCLVVLSVFTYHMSVVWWNILKDLWPKSSFSRLHQRFQLQVISIFISGNTTPYHQLYVDLT